MLAFSISFIELGDLKSGRQYKRGISIPENNVLLFNHAAELYQTGVAVHGLKLLPT